MFIENPCVIHERSSLAKSSFGTTVEPINAYSFMFYGLLKKLLEKFKRIRKKKSVCCDKVIDKTTLSSRKSYSQSGNLIDKITLPS